MDEQTWLTCDGLHLMIGHLREQNAHRKKAGRRNAPPEEWVCLLRDKVPAYIPWEQYEENRRRLAANDRGRGRKATTGRAPTLLNGIVRCGRCGRPMLAHNARPTANPRYACAHEFAEYGGPRCQSVTAAYPDRLIEALVLRAVEPAALELSFRAAERVEQDRHRLHAHWRQQLERAEYEAARARRQYDAVDPENRLVARELERQGEEKLAEATGARMAPPTTLRELARLLRDAQLVIGGDTGPLHLAAALGTPVIGLYGPTNPARNGPYGQLGNVVESYSTTRSMRSVGVDEVMRKIDQVLR